MRSAVPRDRLTVIGRYEGVTNSPQAMAVSQQAVMKPFMEFGAAAKASSRPTTEMHASANVTTKKAQKIHHAETRPTSPARTAAVIRISGVASVSRKPMNILSVGRKGMPTAQEPPHDGHQRHEQHDKQRIERLKLIGLQRLAQEIHVKMIAEESNQAGLPCARREVEDVQVHMVLGEDDPSVVVLLDHAPEEDDEKENAEHAA